MGMINDGKWGWALAGGRVAQAALKAQLFKQWAAEFHRWRKEGRLKEDFAEAKYGYQTWAELMTIIDEDTPDVDRLEALKAMFFEVNKVDASDSERILGYQLWQIAKRLSSGELLLLKTIYENRETYAKVGHTGYRGWAEFMANKIGHGIVGLVDLHEKKLTELSLLTARYGSDLSSISTPNARLTDLAIRFRASVESYTILTNEDEIKHRVDGGRGL